MALLFLGVAQARVRSAKDQGLFIQYSNEPSNVGEPQLDVPHMSSHYIIDILSAFTIAFRQPMIDSRTYPVIAASIFLLGSSNVLALDLTPSIQDANFATAGSYTAVLGALGSTSSGAIGTSGFSTYNWTTRWADRFVPH
jgi:hypothetical protein